MLYEEILRYNKEASLNGRRCLCSLPRQIKMEVFRDQSGDWIPEASFLFVLDGDYEDHDNDKIVNYERAIKIAEESENDELLTEVKDSLVARGYWDAVTPDEALEAVERLRSDAPDRYWLILCYNLAFYIRFEVSEVLSYRYRDFPSFAGDEDSLEAHLDSLLNMFPGLLDRIDEF